MALAQVPRQSLAFNSVFPALDFTTPTPEATPEIGFTSPGQSFGGFRLANNAVDEALQTTRAWSLVTTGLKECLSKVAKPSKEFVLALDHLSVQESSRHSLHDWYLNEVTLRFKFVQDKYASLCKIWPTYQVSETVREESMSILQTLLDNINHCMLKVWTANRNSWSSSSAAVLHDLQYAAYERWSSLVSSLPYRADLQESLATALFNSMMESTGKRPRTSCAQCTTCQCSVDFDDFPLARLEMVGLGGELAEGALANAVARFLAGPAILTRCFQVDWESQESCADQLNDWVRSDFAPALGRAVRQIRHGSTNITQSQEDALAESAITSLGRSRTAAIFDYIKMWPRSEGAVLDIKAYLNLNKISDKAAVCATTDEQLQQRLLHAGASTAEVLGVYVNLINVFNRLDVRGVLLEKVSPTIRTYLRGRNDAINVLAESLFVDREPVPNSKADVELCKAIAIEMDKVADDVQGVERTTDWADMHWLPDPIDAPLNHKSAWTYDVLTYLLSLFDHDELIKEVESVFAQHLLSTKDPELVQETTLLENLKTRLDASKMQNLEVMLKDIRDSINFEKRLRSESLPLAVPTPREIQASIPAEGITITELFSRFETRIKRTHFQAVLKLVATKRGDMLFPKRGRLPSEPHVEAVVEPNLPQTQYRILSGSSWPQMQTGEFAMPTEIAGQLRVAEQKFSNLSGQRKLQWRPALSRMSVTLQLEDRTIEEVDAPAWRVAVINAFADVSTADGRTTQQLTQHLDMDETLVQDALAYWLGRRVLYQPTAGVYAVLETLDMYDGNVEHEAVESVPTLKSQDAVLRENAPMFEAFITNMLSNGGPKEIGGMMGITNMMKMVLPTFTYGDDEVQWLLEQMKSRGLVQEATGDAWAASG